MKILTHEFEKSQVLLKIINKKIHFKVGFKNRSKNFCTVHKIEMFVTISNFTVHLDSKIKTSPNALPHC